MHTKFNEYDYKEDKPINWSLIVIFLIAIFLIVSCVIAPATIANAGKDCIEIPQYLNYLS